MERMKDFFTLRLSTEEREYIDKLARENLTSSADVVRTIIDAYKKQTEGVKYIA